VDYFLLELGSTVNGDVRYATKLADEMNVAIDLAFAF
jgi:hypothetical protein